MKHDATTLLAIPDKFRQTALAFPDQIDRALAIVEDPKQAKNLLDAADLLAHYARRVKADTEIMNAINYGKIKIVGKIGELTPAAKPAETGRGKKTGKAGLPVFSKPTIARYRKVAKHLSKLDKYRASCSNGELHELTTDGFVRFATGTEKAGRSAHVSLNTGVPEWYTPGEIIDAARSVLGEIDLDPASSDKAQETVKATKYHTVDESGLTRKWAGRVWLNPPYTSDLLVQFAAKLCKHVSGSDVSQAIMLVNNATETKWFQECASLCAAVCFPASRVKFLDENGKPGAPLQGQAILYFGDLSAKFINAFRNFGFCVKVVHGNSV